MSDTAIRDVVSIGTGRAAACTQQPSAAAAPAVNERTNACGPIAAAGPGLDYCNAGPHELLAVSSIRRDEIGSAGEEMVLRGDWLIRWTRNQVNNNNSNNSNYCRSVCGNDPSLRTTLTVKCSAVHGHALADWPEATQRAPPRSPLPPCLEPRSGLFWALLPPGQR